MYSVKDSGKGNFSFNITNDVLAIQELKEAVEEELKSTKTIIGLDK